MPVSNPLPWPRCGHGEPPDICRGMRVSDHAACLAHLTDAELAIYLADVEAGANLDLRGTPFTPALLEALLEAQPNLGDTRFDEATFSGDADFGDVTFSGEVSFRGATFSGDADFSGVTFPAGAWFEGATFDDDVWFVQAEFPAGAWFDGAKFFGDVWFDQTEFSVAWFAGAEFSGGDVVFTRASFSGEVSFRGATFTKPASFNVATFSGPASFEGAEFSGDVSLDGARFFGVTQFRRVKFVMASQFGPLVCKLLDLSDAVFGQPVTLKIAAGAVRFVRTRFESTATIRLRYAYVDFSDAVLSAPSAVTAHPVPFIRGTEGEGMAKNLSAIPEGGVRVTSVRGVDAAHLVLAGIDLSECAFIGAFHLDQLRIEGNCAFADPPNGFTRRRVLLEEHYRRALNRWNMAPPWGWRRGPHHPDPVLTPGYDDLAATYRSLRKAFEDVKNEPDAADFYYGEMEMRRHDHKRPWGERALLTSYWIVSGYGLRVSRALVSLSLAMAATVLALMVWGLPVGKPPPVQYIRGPLPSGQGIDVALYDRHPGERAPGPWPEKFSRQRAELAVRTAVNSALFRSAGQGLTRPGTYIEMVSRLVDPALLLLTVLALRGRIKR